jgi:hypothetical protein
LSFATDELAMIVISPVIALRIPCNNVDLARLTTSDFSKQPVKLFLLDVCDEW